MTEAHVLGVADHEHVPGDDGWQCAECKDRMREVLELEIIDTAKRYYAATSAAEQQKALVAHAPLAIMQAAENNDLSMWRAAWELFEARFDAKWLRNSGRKSAAHFGIPPEFAAPPRHGQLGGDNAQTIRVITEQGLGDTLQFSRYLYALPGREYGPNRSVVFEVPRVLIPLMQASFGDYDCQVVGRGEGPDVPEVPLMSIPHLCNDSMPKRYGRYLLAGYEGHKVAEDSRQVWSARLDKFLGTSRQLRIGIAWHGSQTYTGDNYRSFPVEYFAPLAWELPARAGATGGPRRLISLHKHDDLQPELPPWLVQFTDLDAEGGAFMDTAGLMLACDLIITSDTSIAHLAGALGRPTLLLLTFFPDWRWGLHGHVCPWYESVTMVRQPYPGAWGDVFKLLYQTFALKPARPDGYAGSLQTAVYNRIREAYR